MKIKNLFLILLSLIFAGGILGISVMRTSAKVTPTPEPTVTPEVTPAPKEIDYFLVYPGILPDHFLYPIKMVRDRIWLFLTTDPIKKTETLLLFADKRLGAGKALIEGGKEQLGLSTLTKGEKYLEQAVSEESLARQKGKDTRVLLEKIVKASLKHEEVLLKLKERVGNTGIPILESCLNYARASYQKVVAVLGD